MALAALEDIAPLDVDAFRTRRHGAGRKPTVLDAGILKKLTEVVTAGGGLMGTKHFSSTSAEVDAYNDKRASEAKKAEREAPPVLTKVQNAERLARKDAARFTPYVQNIADSMGKAASLRVRNEGTEDKPAVRWAFVIVNTRTRTNKDAAPEATTA